MKKIVGLVVALTVALGLSITVIAPAEAASPTYKLSATFKSGQGKTVLWLTKTGRVIATKALTKSSQAVTLSSAGKIPSVTSSTLQLVTTSGGDYFGPVVLGWASSSKVYTQVNFGSSKSVGFGTITVKAVTAKQGYGKVSARSAKVVKSNVTAVGYRPKGVGTYGKVSASITTAGFSTQSIATQDINLNSISTFAADPQASNYSGADPDADGLPNFVDVNDDGDATIDAADSTTPTPPQSAPAATCEAGASFRIFTNFKSTDQQFNQNINVYGEGSFEATRTGTIPARLTSTLTMVLQPVTQVCGSNVVKTEFRGVGVPYAPSAFVDITGKTGGTGDYQWAIGSGQISGQSVSGLSSFTFTDPSQISGQDTFIQRVTTASGSVYEFTSTAGFVFVTHPLPTQYSNDGGSTWTSFFNVGRTAATYGHVGLTSSSPVLIRMLRPQRLAVEGERNADGSAAEFMDLAGMKYTPDLPNNISGTRIGKCDALTYVDSQMTRDTPVVARTSAPVLEISWNFNTCFSSRISWPTGTNFDADIQVEPSGSGGNSAQKIGFTAN